MPTAKHQPHLDPSAKALADAMAAKGMNDRQLGDRLKLSWSTVYNRHTARSSVDIPSAKAMAKALGCAWEPLVSPHNPAGRKTPTHGTPRKKRGRPKGGQNKPRTPGPASRALALHETALRPVQPPPAAITAPRPTPVLGFELYSDGTSHIALKASLPSERGAALLRQLLDFGLT